MAHSQITIHQSHLPHHFFVCVPVDLAATSYENATEMAYIVLTKSRKGSWRLKDLYRNDLTGEIHCQFGPNSTVTADAPGFVGASPRAKLTWKTFGSSMRRCAA